MSIRSASMMAATTLLWIATSFLLARHAQAEEPPKTVNVDGVLVTYAGIDAAYATAIAKAVAAARAAAIDVFGFDMPRTIQVSVTVQPEGTVRLFNDGADRVFLTIRSAKDLRKPEASGAHHIYGLCHEVGHLAMYRPITARSWLSSAAAEGWAHYVGSRLVDIVFAKHGKALWPDQHDYLVDGTRRLSAQISQAQPDETERGAAAWKEFFEIIGDKGAAPVLKAWGKTGFDSATPGGALKDALLAANDDQRLAAWWDKAEPALVLKQPE